MSGTHEVGLGFDWPAWLQVHIKNATTPDRQRWTAFAMAIEQANVRNRVMAREHPNDKALQERAKQGAELAQPNGVNTRPDDPFWSSSPGLKAFRDEMLERSKKYQWHTHTSFDPGVIISNIGDAISKIPVVGDIVHIAGEAVAAPFNLVKNIASGERLDHALLGALKDQVQIVKDVAPYAQTVVSLVPGIGTGVAAAIGAGAALAEGKSIDEAAKAAIKGAIPGGAIAAAGFDAAMKVASGENVGKAALESARNLVPAGPAQKAFDIGVAVATGEKLQNAVARGVMSLAPDALQGLMGVGQKAIASTPGLSNVVKGLAGEAQKGAQLAAGLMGQAGMSEKAFAAARSKLASAAKQGFDAVLNAQAGHLPWVSNVTGTPLSPELKASVAELYRKAAAKNPAPHVPEPKATPKAAPHVPEPHKSAPKAPEPPKPHEPPSHAPAAPQGAPSKVAYEPYPHAGSLNAPPHPHLPHGHHGGHPLTRGGPRWGGGAPWWGIPYIPEQVVVETTCRTWGAPIEMPPAMVTAARAALGASRGQPTTIRGPDGALYLFAFENGVLTARPCAS